MTGGASTSSGGGGGPCRGIGGDWALLCDWCVSVGVDPGGVDDAALAEFVAFALPGQATRRRRVRQLVRQLGEVGAPVTAVAAPPVESLWRAPTPSGPGGDEAAASARVWLTWREALTRIDVASWPDGFRGRRDAFLVVLAAVCRFTRRQIRDLSETQIVCQLDGVFIDGVEVPAGDQPAGCGACAVTRWLRALAGAESGRASAQQVVVRQGAVWHQVHHDHAVPIGDARWREAWQVMPAIDGHGWLDEFQPLSARSITAITTARQDGARARPPLPVAVERPVRPLRYADLDWDELDEVVDRVCAEADVVLARIAAMDLSSPGNVDA